MASEKRGRGRPPKDPLHRRDRVIAVRVSPEEARVLRFESTYAQAMGKRVTPSDVIRKALACYAARDGAHQDLRRDYPGPPPKAGRKAR